MILYHGSTEKVVCPEIRKSDRTLDYGTGFYTTTSRRQAEDWVRRRLTNGAAQGFVNEYVFDDVHATKLNIKRFYYASEEWVDFVMANRTQPDFEHHYDIVVGPVANDRVYASFALYESRLIDKQTLIKDLATYRLIDQILFHTPAALDFLTFKNTKQLML